MELKDFIKTTVQSVIDATVELKEENKSGRVLINPVHRGDPVEGITYVSFYGGASVPVTELTFDIAVTEDVSSSKGGRAGLRVVSLDIGGEGQTASSTSNVSRIGFSMRVALTPTLFDENMAWMTAM